MLANHGFSYRLTEYRKDDHKLMVVKQKLGGTCRWPMSGKNELLVDDRTPRLEG